MTYLKSQESDITSLKQLQEFRFTNVSKLMKATRTHSQHLGTLWKHFGNLGVFRAYEKCEGVGWYT